MVDALHKSLEGSLPGQIILCIETSMRRGSIALRRGDGTVSAVELDEASSHGSDLLPAIDRLMRGAGHPGTGHPATGTPAAEALAPGALDWIAVGTGPGSYTGLRVGAATALGLSRGADAELVGIPSLAGMALGGLLPGERGAAVRNAFGGHLYLATYERPEDPTAGLVEASAPRSCEPAEALELMDPCSVWLIDDKGLEVLGSAPPDRIQVRPPGVNAEDMLALAMLEITAQASGRPALSRGAPSPVGPGAIKPLYLRPFEVKNRRR